MIYAWIDGVKRQPIAKGERTACKDCGGLLTSVMIKLLEQQAMPHSLVGRHRRVRAEDVFAYKAKRDTERREVLDDIIAGDVDLI